MDLFHWKYMYFTTQSTLIVSAIPVYDGNGKRMNSLLWVFNSSSFSIVKKLNRVSYYSRMFLSELIRFTVCLLWFRFFKSVFFLPLIMPSTILIVSLLDFRLEFYIPSSTLFLLVSLCFSVTGFISLVNFIYLIFLVDLQKRLQHSTVKIQNLLSF